MLEHVGVQIGLAPTFELAEFTIVGVDTLVDPDVVSEVTNSAEDLVAEVAGEVC